jgi:hypothetical protein
MRPVRCALVALSIVALAAPASAAPAQAWDQAKVTELGKQLETATDELWNTFRKQPAPTVGSMQSRSYFRLQQQLRQLRREARSLSRALQGGAGHDETLPSLESMMQTVRAAQDEARRVFSGVEVRDRAQAARDVLNQLTPYFDASIPPVEPVQR